MKIGNLFKSITVCAAMIAAPAYAATVNVTVGGTDWKVSTLDGEFSALVDVLDDQVWWGDEILAHSFTDAVGLSLGFNVDNPIFGPFFAYRDLGGGDLDACATFASNSSSCGFTSTRPNATFAIAELAASVPVPAALPLLMAGLGGLGFVGRRKRKASV